MYTDQVISDLTGRIGWGIPQDEAFVIELTEANSVGTSGRTFKAFHQLVTVENVYAAITKADEDEEKFNEIIEQIRKDAVLAVLPEILDKNDKYITATNYDQRITDNIVLFDDAIGYKAAIMMLELFMSTPRQNFLDRNAKLAISNLKVELNGIRSEDGKLYAQGLNHFLKSAISKASKKIFPKEVIVQKGKDW